MCLDVSNLGKQLSSEMIIMPSVYPARIREITFQ